MSVNGSGISNRRWPAIALVIVTVALLFIVIWRVDTSPRTDDAYAYADTIDVVPEVSGRIINLAVRNNQAVRQGDLLFEIDPRPYKYALAKARASLAELDQQIPLSQRTINAQSFSASASRAAADRARASAAQAADTLRRMEPLLAKGYVSADDLDKARTAERTSQAESDSARFQAQQAQAAVSSVDALIAQRQVMLAEIASAQLNLEYATVRAPFDGRVVSLTTANGQFVSTSRAVFTLIDTRNWYVIANFRETELAHIRTGAKATVYLMSDPAARFDGTVDSIGYGVAPQDGGATSGGLPSIERSINWVHVSQRFPVKIRVDRPDGALFRIGTSAVAVMRPDAAREQAQP
jgi:membrane fusion protein, multidrug efflux system